MNIKIFLGGFEFNFFYLFIDFDKLQIPFIF